MDDGDFVTNALDHADDVVTGPQQEECPGRFPGNFHGWGAEGFCEYCGKEEMTQQDTDAVVDGVRERHKQRWEFDSAFWSPDRRQAEADIDLLLALLEERER